MSKYIGAGILPYAKRSDGIYVFMLGRENEGSDPNKSNRWADFGGGSENKDKNPEETALREYLEETMDAFGDKDYMEKALQNPDMVYINKRYYEYLILIEHDQKSVDIYNRIMSRLELCKKDKMYRGQRYRTLVTCPEGLAEKSQIKWFTANDILKNKDKMRPEFYSTFKHILNSFKKIQ